MPEVTFPFLAMLVINSPTSWITALKKPIGNHLKKFPLFMEPADILLCS
jgi:hypothetical protein